VNQDANALIRQPTRRKNMQAKHLIAAVVALLGSASIFAQAATPLTREQVTAELYRARAAGEICGNEAECGQAPARLSPPVAAASAGRNVHICQNEAECGQAPHRDFSVTRAQVLAELYRARAAGEICGNEAECDQASTLRSR
jgi:demethoxyubiquinone hydroxylase (CLK1/Coq7/Cat5 family)